MAQGISIIKVCIKLQKKIIKLILLFSSKRKNKLMDKNTHILLLVREKRRQWAVYYTSLQSFIITFFGFTTLGTSEILIGCFIKLSVQTFQPLF